ncbi:hypothetical protein V2G26_012037 [Clonostachys chloroleuca]
MQFSLIQAIAAFSLISTGLSASVGSPNGAAAAAANMPVEMRDHGAGGPDDQSPEPISVRDPNEDVIEEFQPLSKRACWFGKTPGCSKTGYCYKRCDFKGEPQQGKWCWTTTVFKTWKTCKADSDCSVHDSCNYSNCKDCGCSC